MSGRSSPVPFIEKFGRYISTINEINPLIELATDYVVTRRKPHHNAKDFWNRFRDSQDIFREMKGGVEKEYKKFLRE